MVSGFQCISISCNLIVIVTKTARHKTQMFRVRFIPTSLYRSLVCSLISNWRRDGSSSKSYLFHLASSFWVCWVTLGKCLLLSISVNCIVVFEYYCDSAYWEEKSSTGKLPANWQLHWDVTDCHTEKWSILGQCNETQDPRVNCTPYIDICKQVCADFWAEQDLQNEAY